MSANLLPLFHPSSIAIIGASADKNKYSSRVVNALRTLKYGGNIFLVNPNIDSISGERVYKQVSDIPGDVDLAVLFMQARAVQSAIEDCARKGVKVSIVHGAGFAELGEEGRVQQQVLAQVARESGMRIVGPNCMGIVSPSWGINMVTTRHPHTPAGGFGFAGQSGWACEYALICGAARGLGFSSLVSCGNQADLSIADYLDYFGSDPDTKVIGAYIEGFKDGQQFFDAAKRTARLKPVVIWKSGRTQAGARFTQSHTGSLAGNDAIARSVMNQVGVEEADGIEDLIDTVVAFTSPIMPRGRRVGVVVDTGGIGVAAGDSCEAMGLEIPQLPSDVQQELRDYLKDYLPPFAGITNPVDLVWAPLAMEEELRVRIMELMAPWVDAFIVGYYPHDECENNMALWLAEMRDRLQKPILPVSPYGQERKVFMQLCMKVGVPSFDSMERAARALLRLVRRAEWLENG